MSSLNFSKLHNYVHWHAHTIPETSSILTSAIHQADELGYSEAIANFSNYMILKIFSPKNLSK
jgi:hypothetical protein